MLVHGLCWESKEESAQAHMQYKLILKAHTKWGREECDMKTRKCKLNKYITS